MREIKDKKVAVSEQKIRELVTTRYNVVTNQVEYSTNGGKTFKPMTDRMEKIILRHLVAEGLKVGVNTVRNILYSDFSPSYNPFNQYFENLKEWDGETDYIANLANTATISNDTYWEKWFKKWLVGVVVGCLDSEKVNHQFLALSGKQGVGKTTFLESLAPRELKRYTSSGYISPDSKDAKFKASECFIMNMDELSSFGANKMEPLKQLITQSFINERRPYGYNNEKLKKRASFCGSTNELQFLKDYTGNRRFLCFNILSLDFDALENIEINNVWSQAYSLYKNEDFQHWFNKEETELVESQNKDFVEMSDIDEAIQKRFEIVSRKDSDNYITMTASDIASYLSSFGDLSSYNKSSQKIGKSLVKLGFERYKSNGKMLYALQLKK